MVNLILEDINEKLDLSINPSNIEQLTNGTSSSSVFKVDQCLVKTFDENVFNSYLEFFRVYDEIYFQKILCYSKELSYICFKFIEGDALQSNSLNLKEIPEIIYYIVSNYKKYNRSTYGYLGEKKYDSWTDFLRDRAYKKNKFDINYSKLDKALTVINHYDIPKFLLHGDLGVHNTIVNNGRLSIIDPRPIVGDNLYDFYYYILSNPMIFQNLNLNDVLGFFDRPYEYKKALMTVCLYIYINRSFRFDKANHFIYKKYLEIF